MSASRKAHWQIHACVLLWGFTAILGKLISLPALALVWWRMLLVTLALLLVPRVWRGLRALPRKLLAAYAGIGVMVALHWLSFYASIKLANASVAATCIALSPVFLSIVEPRISGRRIDWHELLLGLAVVPGVAMVVGGVPRGMWLGIGVGILSALLVAVFGAWNKRLVEHADHLTVTCLELGSGMLFLGLMAWPMALLFGQSGPLIAIPGPRDAAYLLLLSMACTLLPFALSLVALRNLSAFQAQLAVNLEPVYAVLLAIVLLDEQRELSMTFYAGVAVVLLAVFAHPFMARRRGRLSPPEALQ
jgi:drug/metabolite transporter (DMT)-like permease